MHDTIPLQLTQLGLPDYSESEILLEGSHLATMAAWSFVIGLLFALLFALYLYHRDKKYKPFELLQGIPLLPVFIVVFVAGFVVYEVGMYTGEPWSLLGNSFMAVLHAFGIFLLDSDVSAIHAPLHEDALFMFCFSAVHFMAAVVSMAFVIKHFGYNIIANYWMWREGSRWGDKVTKTYLFWGLNDASYCLAKSVCEHHEPADQDYRIIVVRTDNESDTASDRNAMERLFNFVKMRDKDVDRLQELDCYTTSTFAHVPQADDEVNPSFLCSTMRLRKLARILSKHGKGDELHVFILSDNEQSNLLVARCIKHDDTIGQLAGRDVRVKVYCHARYNSIHRVVEDQHPKANIELKVLDSSRLTARLLQFRPELHPVNFVDVQPDATVSSAFNALVIGFAEVGRDVTKFLYEFGAFVDHEGKQGGTVKRSAFHCDIVDRRMAELAGPFVASAPAVNPKIEFSDHQSDNEPWLTLHDMDCNGVEFNRRLVDEWLKPLNYVVIATESDDLNMTLAIRIFRLAVRYKENLRHDDSRFVILVRLHNDHGGQLAGIADYYNRLWAAEKHADAGCHQSVIGDVGKLGHEMIVLFGGDRETYTYDNIIDEKTLKRAQEFHARYEGKPVAEAEQLWQQQVDKLMQTGDRPDGLRWAPTLGGVMKLRRSLSQNISNCVHAHTKARLAQRALREDYDLLSQQLLKREPGTITYRRVGDLTDEQYHRLTRVLETLAQTEHLRWNAAHEMLGYRHGSATDEARLLHKCLCSWADLPDDVTRSYDYNIVDLTRWPTLGQADDTPAP